MDTSEVTAVSAYNSSLFKVTVIGCSISIICLFLTLVILCSIRYVNEHCRKNNYRSEKAKASKNINYTIYLIILL